MNEQGDPWGTPPDDGGPERRGQEFGQPGQASQPEWSQPAQPPGAPPPYAPPPGAPPPGAPYGYGQPTPAYGQPAVPWSGAQPYYGGPQTSGKATTALVLGIVSLVLLLSCVGFIPAIVALVLARGARREIAASGGRLTGDSLVKAGLIMSWITIGLTVAAALALAVVLAVALGGSQPG